MKMKFSAADWCCRRNGVPSGYYRRLASAGCEAVEMAPFGDLPEITGAGLVLLNTSGPGMQEGMNNRANHPSLIPELEKTIRTAAENGVRQVIVFSGNNFGESEEAGIRNCLEGFRKVLPTAVKQGVTLMFEMLNGFDHAGYQATRSAYGFRLARELASPNFRVLYDIYHLHRSGDDIFADLKNNMDVIAHLHIAGAPKRDFPGNGQEIDYARAIGTAKQAGYKGYYGMEFLSPHPIPDVAEAIELFRQY